LTHEIVKLAAAIQHEKAKQLAHQQSAKAVSKAAKVLSKTAYVLLLIFFDDGL
jgi:hypothetical protein